MSFYIYHGKIDNEICVAVLPGGTAERGDTVHLFSKQYKKTFASFKIKDVSVTNGGDDLFTFEDGYYSHQVESSKGYRQLTLTTKGPWGNWGATMKTELIRYYDQLQAAIAPSDHPKIWSGALICHKHADEEAFLVVAPQGLGNGKPIISIWQWIEDKQGSKKVICPGVSKQKSDAATPSKFSFQQGEYYTIACQVKADTNTLASTISSSVNGEVAQSDLALSATTARGEEHAFAPTKPKQEKLTFDCSLPQPTTSLKRFTTPLPLPTDISEALNYSAAYVDQAAYLAKHAVERFNNLQKAHVDLEATSDIRAERVARLQEQVKGLDEQHHGLESKYSALEKHHVSDVKAAREREDDLKKHLHEILAALAASQGTVELLRKHIDQDKLKDIEREKKHTEHISADHLHIKQANKRANKAEAEATRLKGCLDATEKKLAVSEASLKVSREQLSKSEANVARLTRELDVDKKANTQLRADLKTANKHIEKDQDAMVHLRGDITCKDAIIADREKKIQEKDITIAANEKTIREKNALVAEKQKTIENVTNALEAEKKAKSQLQADLKKVNDDIAHLRIEMAGLIAAIAAHELTIKKHNATIVAHEQTIADHENTIAHNQKDIQDKDTLILTQRNTIKSKDTEVDAQQVTIEKKIQQYKELKEQLAKEKLNFEEYLAKKESEYEELETQWINKCKEVNDNEKIHESEVKILSDKIAHSDKATVKPQITAKVVEISATDVE